MEEQERLNEDIPDSLVIKYLIREKKQLLVELGKEKAYSLELEDLLKAERTKSAELREVSKEVKKEIKKEQRYEAMSTQIKSLEKAKKSLTLLRDQLCYKVAKYEKILRENNLL